jgi:hypothetical protein
MPLAAGPNPGSAVPPTTRVHAAVSNTAPHNSSDRVNPAIWTPFCPPNLPKPAGAKHPWWPVLEVRSNTVGG